MFDLGVRKKRGGAGPKKPKGTIGGYDVRREIGARRSERVVEHLNALFLKYFNGEYYAGLLAGGKNITTRIPVKNKREGNSSIIQRTASVGMTMGNSVYVLHKPTGKMLVIEVRARTKTEYLRYADLKTVSGLADRNSIFRGRIILLVLINSKEDPIRYNLVPFNTLEATGKVSEKVFKKDKNRVRCDTSDYPPNNPFHGGKTGFFETPNCAYALIQLLDL